MSVPDYLRQRLVALQRERVRIEGAIGELEGLVRALTPVESPLPEKAKRGKQSS